MVATFRAAFDESAEDPEHVRVDGRIVRDNVYGTLEEDAWRRDFTVNCLYYDHREHAVIDFTGGYGDLRDRRLRIIGHASERYREDPVRMLRAVRFAGKLGFRIDGDASRLIYDLAPLIEDMAPARLYEEVVKLFMGGEGRKSYELLRHHGLFGHLFPESDACIEAEPDGIACAMARNALESTDARIRAGKPVTPGFLFAALLWGPVLQDSEACAARGMPDVQAHEAAGTDVIERQIHHVSLPRRFSLVVREIWGLQPRLVNRRGRGAAARLLHPPEVSGRLRLPPAPGGVGRRPCGACEVVDPIPGSRRGPAALDARGQAWAGEAPPPASPGTGSSAPGAHRAARGLSAPHIAVEDAPEENPFLFDKVRSISKGRHYLNPMRL